MSASALLGGLALKAKKEALAAKSEEKLGAALDSAAGQIWVVLDVSSRHRRRRLPSRRRSDTCGRKRPRRSPHDERDRTALEGARSTALSREAGRTASSAVSSRPFPAV